ncbi:hypothetical protein [Actinokineospora bangkokensis]|uniref:hypothetical protein n=1 Tax=Actinokineospora bangkokensis TaxID=1193682 RepID=UPI0011785581|nr:hypothetical protein [Actinokineospora bangkokensis]
MEDLLKWVQDNLLSLDDLIESGITTYLGTGILVLFLIYGFVSSWLGVAKGSRTLFRNASKAYALTRNTIERSPRAKFIALTFTFLLFLICLTAWALLLIATGAMSMFIYRSLARNTKWSEESFLDLPLPSGWFQFDQAIEIYLAAGITTVLVAAVWFESNAFIAFLTTFSGFCLVVVHIGSALVLTFSLMLEILKLLSYSSEQPAMGWQLTFAAGLLLQAFATYAMISFAAELRSMVKRTLVK